MKLEKISQLIESKLQNINFDLLWKDFHQYPFALYNDHEVYLGSLRMKDF